MCDRSLASASILTLGLVWLVAAPLAAQTVAPGRTEWGHPDLQGTYTNKTITPFERPKEFAGKEFLTAAEAAALEQANLADVADRDERTPDDIVGNYNQHWFDRGTTVVGTRRTSIIVDPRDGRLPSLTPAAQKKVASPAELRRLDKARNGTGLIDTWEDLDLNDRCILWPNAGPPMLSSAYNNNYQILQTPEYVAIVIEMIHDVRIIPLDGRPHVAPGLRPWLGDPRGHWEGDTLVVETTNFSDKMVIRAANNTRPSDALRVIERFRRVDADTIEYRFTIEDPKTWTKPWTGEIPMTRIAEKLYEYACHEANYSLPTMLAGSRALEAGRR
ncbi:MAG: hypothetical protein GEU82_11875 [Luteitalea sp.]|nr:hypothetical protein [Luteitalea sp.]